MKETIKKSDWQCECGWCGDAPTMYDEGGVVHDWFCPKCGGDPTYVGEVLTYNEWWDKWEDENLR